MIIETSANRFYEVINSGHPDLAHCWKGLEVKRDRKSGDWKYTKAAKSRPMELVRMAGCRVVEA